MNSTNTLIADKAYGSSDGAKEWQIDERQLLLQVKNKQSIRKMKRLDAINQIRSVEA